MTQPPVPPGGFPPPPGNFPPPGGSPPPGNFPPPGGYYPPPPAGGLPKSVYTPWITRVAAYLIDALPVMVLTGIGQGIQFGTAENDCTSEGAEMGYGFYCTSQPTAVGIVAGLLFGLAALAFAVWNFGYRQGTTGSSIGKSVLNFKVVGEQTGQPIGFGLSLVRQLAHILDSVLCGIGYLWPLWDTKRQTFADKIMSTICLPTRSS